MLSYAAVEDIITTGIVHLSAWSILQGSLGLSHLQHWQYLIHVPPLCTWAWQNACEI